jgi:hypothetical protein
MHRGRPSRERGVLRATPSVRVRTPSDERRMFRDVVVLDSLLTISSTFDPFFKVLFTFPSLYFFAIGFPLGI